SRRIGRRIAWCRLAKKKDLDGPKRPATVIGRTPSLIARQTGSKIRFDKIARLIWKTVLIISFFVAGVPFHDPLDDLGGRDALDQRNRGDLSTETFNEVAADNAALCPVRSFYQNIRLDGLNQCKGSALIKNRDVVHGPKAGHYARAIRLRDQRPFGSFELPHG